MTFVACAGRSSIGLLAGRSPAVGVFGVCDLAASARYGQPLHVRVPYTHPHAAMTFAGLTLLAIVPPPGEPLRTYSRSVQAGSRLSDMAAATISRQQAHDPGGAGGASSFSQQPAQASTTNQQQQQPHNQQQQVQQQQQQSQQPTGFVNHGLLAWQERRRQWTSRPPDFRHTPQKRRLSEPSLTADQVLSFDPLPQPAPLWEVVEVLLDVWEDEAGTYG